MMDSSEPGWLAVLAHELRSPVSAVIGYGELLAEGALGPLEDRAADAVRRMCHSAAQLLVLIEAMEQLSAPASFASAPVEPCSALALLRAATDAVRPEAAARDTALFIATGDAALRTRPDDALRALVLALGAAVKVSPRRSLRLSATAGDPTVLRIEGSALEPDRDDPAAAGSPHTRPTGAGLRIAFARRAAALVGGVVTLGRSEAGVHLEIVLPLIDGAEDRP